MFSYYKTHEKSDTTKGLMFGVELEYYTYYVEFRLSFAKFIPFIRRMDKRINVKFKEEVGSEKGSWKGGTMGSDGPLNGATESQYIAETILK